ncbi:MAG: hypothetical protein Ta2F_07840 [Termitinemataceae bacterium]|nr:MAG: hypothetical protein Ta2F_07840 [Termitinemataceae bacterium]
MPKAIDTAETVYTAEGIAYNIECAGLFVRACAFAIDTAIQWLIIITVWVIQNVLHGGAGSWILLLVMFIVDWFYHFTWEIAGGGQSPGKRLMGIRVVQSDGSPVSMSSSLLRNLMRFTDVFLFLYLIAILCISGSANFRRIGDWVAGTLVVWTSSVRAAGKITDYNLPEHIIPVIPKTPLSYEEKKIVLMFARRYNILGNMRACEIASAWVDKYCGSQVHIENPADYILGIALYYRRGAQ